jgi:hypothetical protein
VQTKSEIVFEHYCRERGYPNERIEPELNAGRFPDYRLITPAGPVIVEIKEFTPNDADITFLETVDKRGKAFFDPRRPGKRVFDAIRDSAAQLRRYKDTPFPELLLLYDNIYNNSELDGPWPFGRNDYLEPLAIAAGMFGSLRVRFLLDENKVPTDVTNWTHGGGRQLTETTGLYIGAVAVLNEATEKTPIQVDFFHNWFSTKPLLPKYFPHPSDRHFVKPGHPDVTGLQWAEFIGDRQSA